MRKMIFVLLLGLVFISPVHAESALSICTAEAKDAGIEDQEDFRAYVDECVEQVSAEMNTNEEVNDESLDTAQDSSSADES